MFAELPIARLVSVFPPGARLGTTQSITLSGSDLQGVDRLHFADPRLSAKLTSPPATRPTDPLQFALSITPDLPAGIYDLRAVGRFGVTNPRAFMVCATPSSVIPSGHMDSAGGFALPLNVIAFSTCEAKASRYFRVALKKGQRVWIDVAAASLDSMMGPAFVLLDPAGREAAASLSGRPLEFTAGSDGMFVLAVHDLLYRGGVEYGYGVTVSDHPPAEAVVRGPWPIPATAPTTRPSTQPVAIRPPFDVTGAFMPSRLKNRYRFDAAAGAAYAIDVFSARLGQPTSPSLVVQRVVKGADGIEKIVDVQEVGGSGESGPPEFSTATRDPSIRFDVKETGIYQLAVRDLFRDAGANRYVLSVRPAVADFELVAMPASPLPDPKDSRDVPPWTTLVRRGGVTPVRLIAIRRSGFDGEIRVHAIGLPPGLSAEMAVIPAGANAAEVLLAATDDARTWVGPVRFIGVATVGAGEIVREARSGTVTFSHYNAETKEIVVRSRLSDELVAAVSGTEASPLRIFPATQPVVDAMPGTKVKIPVTVRRRGEFVGPIAIRLAGIAALAAVPEQAIEPKANSVDLQLDLAQTPLTPGRYLLHAEAQGKLNYAVGGAKPAEATGSFYSTPFVLNVLVPPPPIKK